MLLDKLRWLDICSPLIDCIVVFLIGRVMRVLVSGIRNNFMDVRSGVSQGSVLGLLLFILFFNHLSTFVVSKCKFYVDDMKIHTQRSNIVDMSSDFSSCQAYIEISWAH